MDVFFAFLTALFFSLWTEFRQQSKMVRAEREAGPLLCRIVLSRLDRVWNWVFFACMIFVFGQPVYFDGLRGIGASTVFVGTVCISMVVTWRPWRTNVMDVCENGIILKRSITPNGLIPRNDIECCRWKRGRGRLRIQRRQRRGDVVCRIVSDQVASATAILSEYVEMRPAARGPALVPLTHNPSGTAQIGGCSKQPSLRSERLAKQFRCLAAISALGWLGVVYQDYQQQEKVLAKFAAFQPEVVWIGFDVFRVDFSNCANKPGNHDLVLLEWLEHLRDLNLDGSPISDAGLKHLIPLKNLESMNLRNTQVTQAGVDELQRALPNTRVHWSPPTPPPTSPLPTN